MLHIHTFWVLLFVFLGKCSYVEKFNSLAPFISVKLTIIGGSLLNYLDP